MNNDTSSEGVSQRVCSWCGTRVGVSEYLSIEERTPARYEGHYFCSREHLRGWLDDE